MSYSGHTLKPFRTIYMTVGTHAPPASIGALFFCALLALSTSNSKATPLSVYPERSESFAHSLNGDWSFKYIPGNDAGADADFSKPDFNVSSWKKISVPSNWELKGFAEPKYALELQDGLGLYQRTFRVPAGWLDGVPAWPCRPC